MTSWPGNCRYQCFFYRFGVGQNLYIYKQSIRRAATDWDRAITDWYDEVAIFSNKKVWKWPYSLLNRYDEVAVFYNKQV